MKRILDAVAWGAGLLVAGLFMLAFYPDADRSGETDSLEI